MVSEIPKTLCYFWLTLVTLLAAARYSSGGRQKTLLAASRWLFRWPPDNSSGGRQINILYYISLQPVKCTITCIFVFRNFFLLIFKIIATPSLNLWKLSCISPPDMRLYIVLFAVAEDLLLLDIWWLDLFALIAVGPESHCTCRQLPDPHIFIC